MVREMHCTMAVPKVHCGHGDVTSFCWVFFTLPVTVLLPSIYNPVIIHRQKKELPKCFRLWDNLFSDFSFHFCSLFLFMKIHSNHPNITKMKVLIKCSWNKFLLHSSERFFRFVWTSNLPTGALFLPLEKMRLQWKWHEKDVWKAYLIWFKL